MHIDSKWKFKEMIQFRDEYAKKYGWNLIVESNMEAFHAGVGPFTQWKQGAYGLDEDAGFASCVG